MKENLEKEKANKARDSRIANIRGLIRNKISENK